MSNHYKSAQFLVELLDTRFKIFHFKFGIDPIIGLIPGIGDLISFLLSLYIVWVAKQMRIPNEKIAIMLENIVLDLILGIIPIIGDATDLVFKANSKNWEILKQHASSYHEGSFKPASA